MHGCTINVPAVARIGQRKQFKQRLFGRIGMLAHVQHKVLELGERQRAVLVRVRGAENLSVHARPQQRLKARAGPHDRPDLAL